MSATPQQLFFDAVKDGNLQKVRQLLSSPETKDKIDIEARDVRDPKQQKELGKTALMLAAERNFCGIIQLLIQHNANCNQWLFVQEKENCVASKTAVMLAAENGHLEALVLFKKHTDLGFCHKENKKLCALHFAAKAEQVEAVKFLLLNGASMNTRDVQFAGLEIQSPCYELINGLAIFFNPTHGWKIDKLMKDIGKDFIVRFGIDYEKSEMRSLLLKALETQHKDLICLLVDGGVNIDMREEGNEYSPFDMVTRPTIRDVVGLHFDPYMKAVFCLAKIRKVLQLEKQTPVEELKAIAESNLSVEQALSRLNSKPSNAKMPQDVIYRVSELFLWTLKSIDQLMKGSGKFNNYVKTDLQTRLLDVLGNVSLIKPEEVKELARKISNNVTFISLETETATLLSNLVASSADKQAKATETKAEKDTTKGKSQNADEAANLLSLPQYQHFVTVGNSQSVANGDIGQQQQNAVVAAQKSPTKLDPHSSAK